MRDIGLPAYSNNEGGGGEAGEELYACIDTESYFISAIIGGITVTLRTPQLDLWPTYSNNWKKKAIFNE